MAAKFKKLKVEKKVAVPVENEIESEEEVIEVKTSKKPITGISSFSQLDTEKKLEEDEEKNEDDEEDTDKQVSEVDDEKETTSEVSKTEEEETIITPELKQDTKTVESAASSDEAKKWLKSVAPELETESASEKGSKVKILIIILVIAVIVGIIAGGFYYYRSKVSSTPEESTQPSTTKDTVVTPEPTEEPVTEEVDLSEYTLSILNGSGVPGEASNVEELLTDFDFSNIETGNAESYDYENTEVSLKENLAKGAYEKIKEALSGEYSVTLSETALDEDSSFDIIIIVGAKK
jgi:hypothetical protein